MDNSVEDLVQNSMGNSVTPSQLLDSNSVGFFRRILGNQGVDGPFTRHLQANEQPHYLFHSTSELSIPIEEDTDSEENITLLGDSHVSPVVAIITDLRSVFVYNSGGSERVITLLHTDLIDTEFTDFKVEKELILRTTQRQVSFGMWVTDPYSSEVADSAAYIADRAELDNDHQEYGFESDDFGDVEEALKDQLQKIQNLADRLNIEKVSRYAVQGAQIGKVQSAYASAVGFALGAGYGIWSDLSEGHKDDRVVDDIDPEETAEIMLRWQQVGKAAGTKKLSLASGALGAAVAIDKQTTGRTVSSVLAGLDVDWVTKQLEEGNKQEAGIKVASEVVESYSTEISDLLSQDFFEQLEE